MGDFLKELNLSEGRATGIPTIQDELRKNGSSPARIETDDERSYFLLEIPCREGFSSKSELKSELKTIKIVLDLITANPDITIDILVKKSDKSRTTVQKCIKKLKEDLCIKREGGRNGGRWIVLIK